MIQGNYLKIPEVGDRGAGASGFCNALSENMTRLDTHSHNGTNSPKIATSDLVKPVINLLASNWVLHESGDYAQSITLPVGYDADTTFAKFIISSGAYINNEIHPTVVKVSTSLLSVRVMDNSFDIKVALV
jgi:hypothetical protein